MTHPDQNDMPEIRLIERHGNVEYSYRTKEFITRNEHWIVNGKRFDHAPTGREVEAAYAEKRKDLAPTSQWRDISVDEPPEGIPVLLAYKNSMKKFVVNNAHIPDWCFEARPYCILGSGGAKSWHREATHWQPLPAPPTKDLAAAEKEGV